MLTNFKFNLSRKKQTLIIKIKTNNCKKIKEKKVKRNQLTMRKKNHDVTR